MINYFVKCQDIICCKQCLVLSSWCAVVSNNDGGAISDCQIFYLLDRIELETRICLEFFRICLEFFNAVFSFPVVILFNFTVTLFKSHKNEPIHSIYCS